MQLLIFSLAPVVFSPFAKGFPLHAVTHMALYRCARKIEGFARDDDTGKTTFQTCPLYEAKDIHSSFVRLRPPYRHFERSREILLPLCSSLSLSRKASHFTLSHIRRYTSVPERSLGFARDDDTGKTTFQTCPLYEAKNIHSSFVRLRPPYRHFERSREILLAPFSCPFHGRFPVSHCHTYGAIPVCKV